MSHAEYVAGCDEEQLKALIEAANARLQALEQSGWVKLWTVNASWANIAWFREDEHSNAVECASRALKARAEEYPGRASQVEISLEQYRPEEVGELLAMTAKLLERQA